MAFGTAGRHWPADDGHATASHRRFPEPLRSTALRQSGIDKGNDPNVTTA